MLNLKVSRLLSGAIVTVFGAFTVCNPAPANAGSFALNEQSVSGLGTAYAGGAAQAGDV